jgi:hypothetical protein
VSFVPQTALARENARNYDPISMEPNPGGTDYAIREETTRANKRFPMVRHNVQIAFNRPSPRALVDQFFARTGLGMNPSGLGKHRIIAIAELDAKSDHDLAQMGLTRDDIVPHVLKDLFSM